MLFFSRNWDRKMIALRSILKFICANQFERLIKTSQHWTRRDNSKMKENFVRIKMFLEHKLRGEKLKILVVHRLVMHKFTRNSKRLMVGFHNQVFALHKTCAKLQSLCSFKTRLNAYYFIIRNVYMYFLSYKLKLHAFLFEMLIQTLTWDEFTLTLYLCIKGRFRKTI